MIAQERGLRSGTVPHHLVVGLGAACEIAAQEMPSDAVHVSALAERLYNGITSRLQGVVVNGPLDFSGRLRYPGNINLSFAYVEGESLIMGLKVEASVLCTTKPRLSGAAGAFS